jgi:hypothetical protein
MKIGDKIIWGDNPDDLREGTVSKMSGSGITALCFVDKQHKPEDCIYQAYTWPAKYKEELIIALKERLRLKKQYDDSIKLLLDLRNKIVRES